MKNFLNAAVLLLTSSVTFAQSDLDKVIRGSEVILSGLTIFKTARTQPKGDPKFIETICIRNKLSDKITYIMTMKDSLREVRKELVIPKDGKECLLNLAKGIYTYEIILANKEVYKKGEYRFEDEIVITIRDNK
ncbi:MAG TPA: hypothetical protein VGB50_10895 [Flavobacterium sp.]|jgi:hypothetical protein